MPSRYRVPVICLLIAVLAEPRLASADPPATCPDELPTDSEVRRRLEWIEAAIDRDEDDVRRWYTAFAALHVVLSGVNVALAFGADTDTKRIPFIVNATGGTLGLVTLLISTPPIMGAGDTVRALPRETADERIASLRVAERRLMRHHDASSFVRGPIASLASALYVEAASLTLLFLDQTVPALLHAGGGMVLGLGRLLLHPTGSIEHWRNYLARHPEAGCESPPAPQTHTVRLSAAPIGMTGGAGLGIMMVF